MISTVQDLAAEALFVSDLQPSESPSRETVEEAVTAMILRHGSDGCAGGVAEEFGDHPEAAVRRMCWVRAELSSIASMITTPRRPHFAS
jgi:hypothetical protein